MICEIMMRTIKMRAFSRRIKFAALSLMLVLPALAAGPAVGVELDTSKATPRTVEDQTKRRIEADYRFAWTNLAEAIDLNDSAPLHEPLRRFGEEVAHRYCHQPAAIRTDHEIFQSTS